MLLPSFLWLLGARIEKCWFKGDSSSLMVLCAANRISATVSSLAVIRVHITSD